MVIHAKKAATVLKRILAIALCCVTLYFTKDYAPQVQAFMQDCTLLSTALLMPDATVSMIQTQAGNKALGAPGKDILREEDNPSSGEAPSSEPSEPAVTYNTEPVIAELKEGQGKILEEHMKNTGVNYKDLWVTNNIKTYDLNIAEHLALKPDINVKVSTDPQVLIFHSHTTESYEEQDLGYYVEGVSMRSQDAEKNMNRVGEAIAKELRAAGIGVIHDTSVHDYPSYTGAYGSSNVTVTKYLKEYPSITVCIDVHRDAITRSGGVRVKPTAVINGRKAAQVMIITGCDIDGTLEFPDWEYNLRLALRFQETMVEKYPGLARPVLFGRRKYNMHVNHGSLLVEFGTEANTFDEAVYAGELFGKTMVDTFTKLQQEG